jgi:hypothetical protein
MSAASTAPADRIAAALDRLGTLPLADWRDCSTHRERQAAIAAARWRENLTSELWTRRQHLASCEAALARLEAERRAVHDALDLFETEAARELPSRGMEELRGREVMAAYRNAIQWLRTGRCAGSVPPGAVVAHSRERRLDTLRPLSTLETELASARRLREATAARVDAAIAAVEAGPPATDR